jgi:hypothetical protein
LFVSPTTGEPGDAATARPILPGSWKREKSDFLKENCCIFLPFCGDRAQIGIQDDGWGVPSRSGGWSGIAAFT